MRSRAVPVTVVLSLLVAVAALVGAFTLRPPRAVQTGQAAVEPSCGQVHCTTLVTKPIAGGTAELRANVDGTIGSLRLPGGQRFDIEITERGAKLKKDSLSCMQSDKPACLVAGNYTDGRIADVFVADGKVWSKTDAEITSRNRYVGLSDSTDNPGPEVVAVQTQCSDGSTDVCAQPAYFAQVFTLYGSPIGCTKAVSDPDSLPGGRVVMPQPENVHTCE